MEKQYGETSICCPEFDPVPWDEKKLVWQDKLFIRDSLPQFLHIPLPGAFAKTVTRMWGKIDAAGARPDVAEFLMLAYDPSPWRSELYIRVTLEVSGAANVKLSGTFLTRVFEGPYKAVPDWIKEMQRYVVGKDCSIKKLYFYYTTCPKCARKYGKNYVVVFAEI